ncbi:MFS transporter [Shouchella miscanthi]|uniref:MFS transporter n=1 Tax=Shouchella miscanthi TaxID=2598861 RepID=UPI0011A65866|nr:MFS transporter [Shouchella miscanthi]
MSKHQSVFTHKSFVASWSGNAVSELGGAFGTFCNAIIIFQLTGSTLALGSMWLLYFTPSLILQLFIGPFIDRWSKKWVMVSCQWVRASVFCVPLLAMASGEVAIWHIYVVQLIVGLVTPLYVPANQALLPTLVNRELLKQANAYIDGTARMMMFLSPLVAGLVIEVVGVPITLLVVCSLLILSGVALLFIEEKPSLQRERKQPWLAELREGYHFFFKQKTMLWLGVFLTVVQFGVGVTMVTTLPYVIDNLSGTYAHYGYFMAGFPIGYMLGSIIVAKVNRIRGRRVLFGALVVGGMTFTVLALNQSIAFAILTEVIGGMAMAVFSIHHLTICQKITPTHLMGNVFSIRLLLIRASMPFGILLGGTLGDLMGVRPLYLFIGFVISGTASLGMLLPYFKFIDDSA